MKQTLRVLGAACVLAAGIQAHADNFAMVDMNRLASQSSYSENLQRNMMLDFKSDHDELLDQEKALQQNIESFEREADLLSQSEREEREEALIMAQQKLREQQSVFSQKLNARREEDMDRFFNRVKHEVGMLAQAQDIALVVPSEVVLYAQGGLDLTDTVMEHLNANEQ